MHILLRIMGYVAGLNQSLSRQSINFIPANWLLIGVSGAVGLALGQVGLRDRDPQAIPIVLPALLLALVFLLATLKSNTFFQAETANPLPAAPSPETVFQTALGFTGKLRLHEKAAQRFLDVPAHLTRLESGALAFVSNIDASTRFSGVVTQSKVGLWISVPQFEATPFECGTLFYGKKPRPALRLQFTESAGAKPARAKAILSFNSAAERDAMSAFLASQTASSAAPRTDSPFATSTG